MSRRTRTSRALRKRLKLLGRGARNALELVTEGRIAAPTRTPFEIVTEDDVGRLRRYCHKSTPRYDSPSSPLLLVPPLMVFSEVYDISPELSAVAWLLRHELDTWLIDFGAPEHQAGGMKRSLDDHVLAVDRAIDQICQRTCRQVHLIGYSQGGMFCYETAAYRQSRDIASIVTFGTPVDLSRNLPLKVHDELAERLLHAAGKAAKGPLEGLDGLSAFMSSSGFKLLYPGNELKHFAKLIGLLPDRRALALENSKRRFLSSEGFVAWPGPALRDFLDQLVAENRLAAGGLIIDRKPVSLTDIRCPLLYFYGRHDNLARPSAVKAIERVAPHATMSSVEIDAGHFGLVVGSKAMQRSWPIVVDWVRWHTAKDDRDTAEVFESTVEPIQRKKESHGSSALSQVLYRAATDAMDDLWLRLGEASLQATDIIDILRWQLPRMARLESVTATTRLNLGLTLADQARAIPDATFLFFRGRAYTYAQANQRVNRIAAALYELGIRRESRVAIQLDDHPDFLTLIAAMSRIGAVSVPLNPQWSTSLVETAIRTAGVDLLVVDGARGRIVMGDGQEELKGKRSIVHIDALMEEAPSLPNGMLRNPGRAAELAMLIHRKGEAGTLDFVKISNGRWAIAALGTAAGCRLSPRDTLYCCVPLHTSMGTLIAAGGALVGGARLALANFTPTTFLDDVRRTGSTIIPYSAELIQALLESQSHPQDKKHPIRLFLGAGLDVKNWVRLKERFGPVSILEFYARSDSNFLLANIIGDKAGCVGRPVVRESSIALVRFDATSLLPLRNSSAKVSRVRQNEPGLLIARIDRSHPLANYEGFLDPEATEARILRNVFRAGDEWFNSLAIFRRDADGDYWLASSKSPKRPMTAP